MKSDLGMDRDVKENKIILQPLLKFSQIHRDRMIFKANTGYELLFRKSLPSGTEYVV